MTMTTHPDLGSLFRANWREDRHVHLVRGADDETTLSFSELGALAEQAALALTERGIEAGHELVICTRSNVTFLAGFWGAVLAGVVPVPIAVGKTDEQRQKLTRVITQLRHPALLHDGGDDAMVGLDRQRCVDHAMIEATTGTFAAITERDADSLAFIQYSSGSTGDPKGVRISHRNVTAHCGAIRTAMGWSDADRGLSWMPLTHDMGLIVMHVSQLAAGMTHTIMDTDLFIRRPQMWLERASEDRASVLCSPNFGYKHFLKFYDRRPSNALALGAVRTIFNGAEPISRTICDEFLSKMSAHGLAASAMTPVYGLAEGTVGVTLSPLGESVSSVCVSRHQLKIGERVLHVEADSPDALELVHVGTTIPEVELRVVDDADNELAHEHVGHLQIRGASVTDGFYGLAEHTRAALTVDGWFRTGDCGFIDAGQLVVSGRMKDIVIVSGQNYYAHDLERFAFGVGKLELGKVAVAAAQRSADATEQTVVFALFRGSADEFKTLSMTVAERIATGTGVTIDYAVPVARIPKTTSGKVQRSVLGQNFAMGEYDAIAVACRQGSDDDSTGNSSETAPKSAVETLDVVLAICREHAAPIPIDADDDLFDVGISSLTLTEISLGVDERYPGVVSIDDLFDCPTPRQIAARIDESG
ncbi:MAG: non-ribosomal peptide synthetase [Pseudomonadota bacterium]